MSIQNLDAIKIFSVLAWSDLINVYVHKATRRIATMLAVHGGIKAYLSCAIF